MLSMASSKSKKKILIDQLVTVFKARGYEGATLTQLANVTGLGKASLYHHFPGGKAEMASVLLRHAVADLQQKAFRHLTTKRDPLVRITNFIAGFDDYAEQGNTHCLVAVLAQGSASETHGSRIAQQFQDWQASIAQVFEESGMKPKKSKRTAASLLSELYGSLLLAKLNNDPSVFQRAVKRLTKTYSAR